jgi:GH24 family phage-related lysozyme (muramidase)
MDDERVGKVNESWPRVTVTGKAYQRPVSTLTIGNGYFVVLDTFPTVEQTETIATLRKKINLPKAVSRAARKESSENA